MYNIKNIYHRPVYDSRRCPRGRCCFAQHMTMLTSGAGMRETTCDICGLASAFYNNSASSTLYDVLPASLPSHSSTLATPHQRYNHG